MRRHRLADETSAVATVNALWQHAAFREARQVWEEWLDPGESDSGQPNVLTNMRFAVEPRAVPFPVGFGHQRFEVRAGNLILFIAKNRFCAFIPENDFRVLRGDRRKFAQGRAIFWRRCAHDFDDFDPG